jgi:hypothetical protein
MKFVLLVEGQTERDSAANFLKRWLDPQLGQPVGIQSVAFDGYADLVRKVATKAKMYLEGRKQHEIMAVIGLLDLYGPQFYPGHLATVRERHEWGVAHFQTEVGFDRFRMYFAVHEFEAWLLAQPEIFPREIRDERLLPGVVKSASEGCHWSALCQSTIDRLVRPRSSLA